MREAIKNFVLVSVGILLCLFTAGIYLRAKSLAEPVKPPFKHAFFESTAELIAYGGLGSDRLMGQLDGIPRLRSNLVLWIDAGPDANGEVVLLDKNLDPSAIRVSEALEKFPKNRFVVNFSQNRPGFVAAAIKAIDHAKAGDRVLVQSPEEGFLREVREQRPLWIYGSSRARAVQMKMLASFGLESMAPIKGDAFIVEWSREADRLRDLSDSVIREIHRRKMKLIVGPVESEEEAKALLARGVDSVLVTQPSTFVDQAHRPVERLSIAEDQVKH